MQLTQSRADWVGCAGEVAITAVWLITAPGCTRPHRTMFLLIRVYCRRLLTEIWRWPIPTWSREDSESVQAATCWAVDDFADWLTLTMRLTHGHSLYMTVMYNLVAIVQHSFFCLTFNTLYSLGLVFIFCLFSASVTFFTFLIQCLFFSGQCWYSILVTCHSRGTVGWVRCGRVRPGAVWCG